MRDETHYPLAPVWTTTNYANENESRNFRNHGFREATRRVVVSVFIRSHSRYS
jgi:hypothetical protein